jgi:plastocyanin
MSLRTNVDWSRSISPRLCRGFSGVSGRTPAKRGANGKSALVVIAALFLIGCNRKPATPPVAATVLPGPGIVQGVVKFAGEIPPVKIIGGACFPGAAVVEDESAVVNPDHTLKNVVVYIKAGPNIQTDPVHEAVLAQIDCRYVPHVRGLRTGQVMNVTSHDPIPHNVHVESTENPSDNFAELQGGSHAVHFDHPGIVRFKCDVHPWMTAYVYVFDNPCFAVTGDDGKFEIGHLPPGSYTLVAWQEKYGTIEKPFVVVDGKPVMVDFEYRP